MKIYPKQKSYASLRRYFAYYRQYQAMKNIIAHIEKMPASLEKNWIRKDFYSYKKPEFKIIKYENLS